MQILIVGGGGREHALAWKAATSAKVEQVFVAPGNAGCALEAKVTNVPIAADDVDSLCKFAAERSIDLTIIGPEQPLVAGIVDRFKQAELPIFGPSRAAAQLEGSKAFTKAFLARHNIPTARYATVSDLETAADFIESLPPPIVVKADGLAAGKGVIIANDHRSALAAVNDMLSGDAFGHAGKTVVIEEFLEGEEASFIAVVDGTDVVALATSQDHKAAHDGDTGPNTGGMGAYSPAPVVTDAVHEQIMREIITPTVQGMAADGNPFTGFLYAGLMIANDQANVIEYNVRLGDPEAQPLLMRLESDLIDLCQHAISGTLASASVTWCEDSAVGVVMAAGGYPGTYQKGSTIRGLDNVEPGCKVFHAGTETNGDRVTTSGGRVLCVTALGKTVREAQQSAYAGVKAIDWSDVYYRTDIAHRAIERES